MVLRKESRYPKPIGKCRSVAVAPVITLTTDFGLSDHYVAAIKGSILTISPGTTIVDISHDAPAQGIEQAAFLLTCAFPHFPHGSIHVAVVDPGVGTGRRPLALVTEHGVFIGPDNGILSAALPDDARAAAHRGPQPISLPEGALAFLLAESRFQSDQVSDTFHARDIFAPVAAHVSIGVDPSDLGPAVEDITALPPFKAEIGDDGALVGRVIHVDGFGNVITTARGSQLPSSAVRVEIGAKAIDRLTRTYADYAGLSALVGSSGFLEIALNGGSAARELGVQLGDPVVVRPT